MYGECECFVMHCMFVSCVHPVAVLNVIAMSSALAMT